MDTTIDNVTVYISKKIMEDYEQLRKFGVTNMFDYRTVIKFAGIYGMEELAALTRQQYADLLSNYEKLNNHYGL